MNSAERDWITSGELSQQINIPEKVFRRRAQILRRIGVIDSWIWSVRKGAYN